MKRATLPSIEDIMAVDYCLQKLEGPTRVDPIQITIQEGEPEFCVATWWGSELRFSRSAELGELYAEAKKTVEGFDPLEKLRAQAAKHGYDLKRA